MLRSWIPLVLCLAACEQPTPVAFSVTADTPFDYRKAFRNTGEGVAIEANPPGGVEVTYEDEDGEDGEVSIAGSLEAGEYAFDIAVGSYWDGPTDYHHWDVVITSE